MEFLIHAAVVWSSGIWTLRIFRIEILLFDNFLTTEIENCRNCELYTVYFKKVFKSSGYKKTITIKVWQFSVEGYNEISELRFHKWPCSATLPNS